MRILYGFSGFSEKKYKIKFKSIGANAAIKYHGLLIKGFAKNGVKVNCFSGLPINRNVTKKIFICEKDDQEYGVNYHYFNTINLPILRQLGLFFKSFFAILRQKNKSKDKVVICDCLNIATCYGMAKAAKIKKMPLVLIVTDLPDMLGGNKFLKKINNKIFKNADGFVLLTEQMDEKINKKGKPYIVLEGHSDAFLADISDNEKYEYKDGKKILIYAGSIKKIYGIKELVEGFISAKIENSELHIYGDGDFAEDLKEICKGEPTVIYHGVKPNEEIVYQEQRAALLINPRPTEPEYTKYSFPSKNMEYMVSGTPILTTVLPGMPKEYYPYIYSINDETSDGIAKTLKDVLNIPKEERTEKGKAARTFVLENKNNVIQAKKILNFLDKEIL